MSTKKKIEKELEKENIIKEIKKAQTDVAVAEKFFQFVSDPELVDVAIYNLEAKKSRYRYLIKIAKEKGGHCHRRNIYMFSQVTMTGNT